ncbi:MAG TPA: DUF1841 family protein [Burkholderiaceae bacterium]
MFNPSQHDVRRFFCEAWRKHRAGEPASPLERQAIACVLEHPEYHALLDDAEQAQARRFTVESGTENPFLHMSMHLALEEQASIDQPPGVSALLERLRQACGERHAAMHEAMECLGEMIWRAQRATAPADTNELAASYLECLARRAGRH